MESQNVSLDNTSASYKMALTDETEKTNTNINGDDTLASSNNDIDNINDSVCIDSTKDSDKSNVYHLSGVEEPIKEKQSVLCSDNNSNNDSIIKHNESSVSDNVCVNSNSTNVFNELEKTEKQSSEYLNDSETVSSVTKSKDGSSENFSNEKVQNEDEEAVLDEVEVGALQEDSTNVNNTDEDELLKDTNADMVPTTSLKEASSQQNLTSTPEKDDNVNIDNNSSVSEELSVSGNYGNTTNEKDNTIHEEEAHKDICDNSNASTAASRDHDDSNPPFGTDETSMNLSETGAGSGSECERTERTRFLQCDDMIQEGDDVMDVIEVNAVDPFAQTIDSERNDDTSMDVDDRTNDVNNQEASDDMEITHGMVQEMDVTKITDKTINETDKTEVDKDEAMDIGQETDKDADSTKICEQDMDETKITEKETNETETNEDKVLETNQSDKVSETNKDDKVLETNEDDKVLETNEDDKVLETNEDDKAPETNEDDKVPEAITEESEKDLNQTDVTESDMDVTETNSKSANDSDKCDSKAGESSSEKDSKEENDNKKPETDEISEAAKVRDENKDTGSKDKESKDLTDSNEVENKESDTSTSETKSKDGDSSKSSVLKTSTVVENDDEDVCIIPDTMPRVSNDPVVISKITDKLRTILTKSKTNIIQGQTESITPPSTRPQRQAAKRADAQIKATVHQLEDDDGEKENDEEDVDDVEEQVETRNVTTTTPPQQQQSPNQQICQQCCKMKVCRFKILSQGKVLSYLCSEACSTKYRENLNEHIVAARAKKIETKKLEGTLDKETKLAVDNLLSLDKTVKEANGPSISDVDGKVDDSGTKQSVVSVDSATIKRPVRRLNDDGEFIRACSECGNVIQPDERTLSWETMDFCNEVCLGKYQTSLGSHCSYCKKAVLQVSLGKYCVRFGYDIRQFCCASCLEEFKKGLKVCSYCQKDISSSVEGFLAPVGDKGQFKDFCTQSCMEKYDQMSTNQRPPPQMYPCDVCKNNKLVQVEVLMDSRISKLCSEVCFAAFKFVNTIKVDQCDMCRKYFDRANGATENLTVYYEDAQHNFCSKTCMNVYILAKRKIVPCNWCKVKKYNFDMIKRITTDGQGVKQSLMMCSLNCLTLYQVSVNAVSSRRIKCDSCSSVAQAQYHLTMSDATIRNFCNYNCVMKFQAQYNKSPITLPGNQNTTSSTPVPTGVPVISSVKSLATSNSGHMLSSTDTSSTVKQLNSVPSVQISNASTGSVVSGPVPVSLQTAGSVVAPNVTPILPASPTTSSSSPFHVIVKPTQPTKMVNKQTHCRPYMHTKGVSCRPHACVKQSQTDNYEDDGRKILIPVPVPIYIPTPMHMFTLPTPVPFPIPLPVPVPIFIPTTRRSAKGIMQEIKKIQEKMPADPFEAELLMMAEMVAEQKKQEDTSESEDDSRDADSGPPASVNEADDTTPATRDVSETNAEGGTSFNAGEVMEANSNTFGADDMLQMALKMATEMDDQSNSSAPVDLEAELTPNTITPAAPQAREISSSASSRSNHTDGDENEEDVDDPEPVVRESRGRKRVGRPPGSTNRRNSSGSTPPVKRPRKSKSANRNTTPVEPTPPPVQQVPVEKPDANMCLKYTIGVNAWKQWVTAKNNELEKLLATSGNNKKVKLFKTELLQLTADELNYSLCLFVKEARKPNGTTYAPDTIYYFCLGIQQYLFENGRIDNIFTDPYYEKFTECLDEVAKVFSEVSDDTKLIVTRVEEEHLWESKQLGAHSPHVLLSTLMFFNTKNFNLTSVDEHMQLSFSHIMKHWKKNPGVPGSTPGKPAPGSRNVLLRFYPPQSALDANSKKKKVYEQQENEENPLRCPVKLYEFYLSKCPESVKTRNDVFYLLPERSCVPDSPVWYSTMALGKEPLLKMLHRVKMIKEINIALRSS